MQGGVPDAVMITACPMNDMLRMFVTIWEPKPDHVEVGALRANVVADATVTAHRRLLPLAPLRVSRTSARVHLGIQ